MAGELAALRADAEQAAAAASEKLKSEQKARADAETNLNTLKWVVGVAPAKRIRRDLVRLSIGNICKLPLSPDVFPCHT